MFTVTRKASHYGPLCASALVVLLAAGAAAAAEPAPQPSPTPRPGTLAAFARGVTLHRPRSAGGDGRLVIATEDLAELGAGGALTVCNPPVAEAPAVAPRPTPSARERAQWRRRYRTAKAAVRRVEARRDAADSELQRLQSEAHNARGLARVERAAATLRDLEGELRRAEDALTVVVREARRHGAEPGWFRGL